MQHVRSKRPRAVGAVAFGQDPEYGNDLAPPGLGVAQQAAPVGRLRRVVHLGHRDVRAKTVRNLKELALCPVTRLGRAVVHHGRERAADGPGITLQEVVCIAVPGSYAGSASSAATTRTLSVKPSRASEVRCPGADRHYGHGQLRAPDGEVRRLVRAAADGVPAGLARAAAVVGPDGDVQRGVTGGVPVIASDVVFDAPGDRGKGDEGAAETHGPVASRRRTRAGRSPG